MKAVFFHKHGGNEVLQYGDLDAPQPTPGQVQINIKAAALNRLDLWVRDGWPGIKLEYPHIPGADGAGVVSAIGEGVTKFAVGDRVVINGTISDGTCDQCLAGRENLCRKGSVLGEHLRGTFAEYIVLPDRNLLRIPDAFSFEEAAASSLVFLTAWHSLVSRGQVKAGESVLVVGATGGVNTAAMQIAKYLGATVYVVGSSAEKLEKAQELGADVLIDRGQDDWGKSAYVLTDKQGVDVVVDNVGQATWPTSLRTLKRGGRMLVVGNTSGYNVQIDSRYIFNRHISIIGSTMSTTTDFETVMGLIFEGNFKAVIDQVLPLKRAAAAYERLERGEATGKLVLTP